MAGFKHIVGDELKVYVALLHDSRNQATERMLQQTQGNAEILENFIRNSAFSADSVMSLKRLSYTFAGHNYKKFINS